MCFLCPGEVKWLRLSIQNKKAVISKQKSGIRPIPMERKIAQLLGDTEKMVLDVYNHIILEKEDASTAVENALDF